MDQQVAVDLQTTAQIAVLSCKGTQYVEMKPKMGMMMMKVVLSQSMCLYQLFQVMGNSEM